VLASRLGDLSPARRRFVLAVLAVTLVLVGLGIALYVVKRDPGVQPVSQREPGPVVLVPGYGGSTAGLEVLGDALEQAGRDVSIVRPPGDGTGDLREQAVVLDEAVRAAIERSGASSADVVGYSAGGVVARVWVRDLGGGDLARRVVTLGSPQHGTDVAGLASDVTPDTCPAACRQLAPDSDLLRRLNAGDETPAGPLWVSIWTQDDTTVVPPESASLDGALDFSVQSVCPSLHVVHGDLPRDPTVIAMTIAELQPSTPELPTQTVCAG
jgi:triacylglycerol esterase/lipase EstA (alpha/beta hydrolase family)